MAKWIKTVVDTWSVTKVTPPSAIFLFVVELAAVLSRNELKFSELNNDLFFSKLVKILYTVPSVQLSYIKLLSAFLEHHSGIQFLVISNFWEDIYRLSLTEESRESSKFLTKFLKKARVFDEFFCNSLVEKIISPLKIIKNETTIRLIASIFENIIESVLLGESDFRIAYLFLENFRSEKLFDNIFLMSQENDVYFLKIMYVIEYLDFNSSVTEENNPSDAIKEFYSRILNDFLSHLGHDNFYNTMELSSFGFLYWKLIETNFPLDKTGEKDRMPLSDHFLGILLFPNMIILYKYFMTWSEAEKRYADDECRNICFHEHLNSIEPVFFHVATNWKRILMESPFLFNFYTKSFCHIEQIKFHFTKNSALLIFKKLIYHLKDIVTVVRECPDKLQILSQKDYFSVIFELLALLLDKFAITWKDLFEAVNVIAIAFDFLMLSRWSPNEIVQALKLINVAIKNYMSPNMLLLVDISSDSTLDLLGPLLAAELVGPSLVKIAALEVVYTMADMSGSSKFYLYLLIRV